MKGKLGALLALVAFVTYLIMYMVMALLQLSGKGSALNPETVMWRGIVIVIVFWIIGRIVGAAAGKLFLEVEAEKNIKEDLYRSSMWLPEIGKRILEDEESKQSK